MCSVERTSYIPRVFSHQKAHKGSIEIDDDRYSESQSVDENIHDCNVACAIRLGEVVNDFRTIQHKLIDHSADDSLDAMTNGEKSLMDRCQKVGNQLLQLPTLDASIDSTDSGTQLKK